MKLSNRLVQRVAMTAVVALAGTFSGMAATGPISMTLISTGFSVTDVGMSGPGISLAPNTAYIGAYQFQINGISASYPSGTTDPSISGLTVGEKFYAICLSPSGELDWNPHTYDYDSFAQAAPGLNPSNPTGWAIGIQNAAFLWQHFGNSLSSSDAQGAGLAMAMYEALYNSTALGVTGTGFQPNFNGDTATANACEADITYLENNLAEVAANEQTGYVLVPDPTAVDGSGQEFLVLAPASPNIPVPPVPEATTLIAGALLVLPFGASTLRILRRRYIA